jgi:hypothetical protein
MGKVRDASGQKGTDPEIQKKNQKNRKKTDPVEKNKK